MSKDQRFIFICTGKSCKKSGSKMLTKQLKPYLKGSGTRIIKTKCMDYCKLGPNVVVDNQLLHDATLEEVMESLML